MASAQQRDAGGEAEGNGGSGDEGDQEASIDKGVENSGYS